MKCNKQKCSGTCRGCPASSLKGESLEKAHEIIVELLEQHAIDRKGKFDSLCLSANERAIDYAVKVGIINKKDVSRF